jgi:GT2 family glycosyltransferase
MHLPYDAAVTVDRGQIDVVVPTYQRADLLARCLDSFAAQTADPTSYELLVVDDGSTDGTPEVIEAARRAGPVRIVAARQPNAGPAAARNRAVRLGSAPLLLFVDDDIVATPELVATHLELHRNGPREQGYVGLVSWEPSLQVTPFMRWLDGTDLQFTYGTSLQPGRVPRPEDAFYTCNLSLSRSLFDEAGGFDESFPYPAYEDVELGHRLAAAGFVLDYTPEAMAFHNRPITLAEFRRRMEFVAESAVRIDRIHPGIVGPLVPLPDGLGAAAVRVVARAACAVRPVWGSRDVRARHYWAEVHHALAVGMRRAQRASQT